jgi:integrase
MDEKTKKDIEDLKSKLKDIRDSSKTTLELIKTLPNLKVGMKSDGKEYSVRDNRDRYFYPDEWQRFYAVLKESQQMTFDFLINTGARINEAEHVNVNDIDFNRNTIIFRVTKVKAVKGEKNSRPRTVKISNEFARKLKRYIADKNLKLGDALMILSKPAAHIAMKKALKKIGIADWYMFSIHNIRKTHGNWIKALGVDGNEICLRLGHDMNTFIRSYGSSNVFSKKDTENIRDILGDLYEEQTNN